MERRLIGCGKLGLNKTLHCLLKVCKDGWASFLSKSSCRARLSHVPNIEEQFQNCWYDWRIYWAPEKSLTVNLPSTCSVIASTTLCASRKFPGVPVVLYSSDHARSNGIMHETTALFPWKPCGTLAPPITCLIFHWSGMRFVSRSKIED